MDFNGNSGFVANCLRRSRGRKKKTTTLLRFSRAPQAKDHPLSSFFLASSTFQRVAICDVTKGTHTLPPPPQGKQQHLGRDV